MSDAYGTVIFVSPEEGAFDAQGLCDAANTLEWGNAPCEWVVNNYQGWPSLMLDGGRSLQYPTVIHEETVALIVWPIDGEPSRVLIAEATQEHWDQMASRETAPMALQKVSEILSPYVKSHWVEFACCYAEKQSYVGFQSLRIYSDGRVERRNHITGCSIEIEHTLEVYSAVSMEVESNDDQH